jgi:hypothetical protein
VLPVLWVNGYELSAGYVPYHSAILQHKYMKNIRYLAHSTVEAVALNAIFYRLLAEKSRQVRDFF